MFNLVSNWRYIGNLTKVILYATNIIAAAFALLLMLTYIPSLNAELTRGGFASLLIQMQIMFNVPILVVLSMSGLFRRTIAESDESQNT